MQMGFTRLPKKIANSVFILIAVACAGFITAPEAHGSTTITVKANTKGGLGTIRGIVRDNGGSPIAQATVAIFKVNTFKALKQVKSAADGSFLAKILPGTYTVLAVAEGFNPSSVPTVEVTSTTNSVYGFKLERAGGGNTIPERRVDRNNSKWRIRAAHAQRSIYQHGEGDAPVDEETTARNEAVEVLENAPESADENEGRQISGVVETYAASTSSGAFSGMNFAALMPIGEQAEVVFAGQTGIGRTAPQRFETGLKFRPNDKHQVSLKGAVGRLGSVRIGGQDRGLGQVSFQALDEWRAKGGLILVFGFDYARFTGAGSDSSFSPRFGLQYDINSKTRFRTAFTPQTEEKTWAHALELEGAEVVFREPVSMEDVLIEQDRPRMNKSNRLEFGIERVLDNRSSVEANVFFDTTLSRGLGLVNMPINALGGGESFTEFVANQQGRSQGVRVVYTRRLNGIFSASAGYSFGSGQKLSDNAIGSPADVFENDHFQTFYTQLTADLKTGTHVKTIFRLSPQATVFAIDPFRGRLAIYDPGLSVVITQSLPTLGLPFRAEAVVDARNLFDTQSGVIGEDGSLRINSQQRALRGGILVRF